MPDGGVGPTVGRVSDPEVPIRSRPWAIRLATTLVVWPIAFLIVLALLRLFGDTIESLSPALDALVFTAVLVPIMGNLVMPFVGGAVARRLAAPPIVRTSAPGASHQTPGNSALPHSPTDDAEPVRNRIVSDP